VSTTDFKAIAMDGDGTLMRSNHVAQATVRALKKVHESGRMLLLVTGENLQKLHHFPHVNLFDLVIGENGAILYAPSTGAWRLLAERHPPELVRCARSRGISPLKMGEVAVSTTTEQSRALQDVIKECGIPWRLTQNRDDVMALPKGVDKSSGLSAGLTELKLPRRFVVGIGDAENDIALLSCCGFGVAVRTAVPDLRQRADLITEGGAGRGVVEVIERILAGTLRPSAKTWVRGVAS